MQNYEEVVHRKEGMNVNIQKPFTIFCPLLYRLCQFEHDRLPRLVQYDNFRDTKSERRQMHKGLSSDSSDSIQNLALSLNAFGASVFALVCM